MELKYKVIKDWYQWRKYEEQFTALRAASATDKSEALQDEIELLGLLMSVFELEQNTIILYKGKVEALQLLMKERKLRPGDLVKALGVSKGYVSDILHGKKPLSRKMIEKLAALFKVSPSMLTRSPQATRTSDKELIQEFY